MWMLYINVRLAIWLKIKKDATIEERSDPPGHMENIRTILHLSIPYDGFRIFGFLDGTGFRNTETGI